MYENCQEPSACALPGRGAVVRATPEEEEEEAEGPHPVRAAGEGARRLSRLKRRDGAGRGADGVEVLPDGGVQPPKWEPL